MSVRICFLSLLLSCFLVPGVLAQTARIAADPSSVSGVSVDSDLSNDSDALQARFGQSVHVSGDWAFVGEPNSRFAQRNSVFVFNKLDGMWTASDTLPGPVSGEQFGQFVTRQDDLLFIGAASHEGAGGVYVYALQDSEWVPTDLITAEVPVQGSAFGSIIDVDTDLLLVGAPEENNLQGAAYAFHRQESGDWEQEARLEGTRTEISLFAFGLTLTDGGAAIGAQYSDDQAGVVYVFERDDGTGTWALVQEITGSEVDAGSRFGRSLDSQGDVLIVGSPGAQNTSGSIYSFTMEGNQWTEEAVIHGADVQGSGYFGWQVSLAGDRLGVSGYTSGKAHIFERLPEGWTHDSAIVDPTGFSFSNFGYAVDLSGNTLLVGAITVEVIVFYDRNPDTGTWDNVAFFNAITDPPARIEGRVPCAEGKAGIFPCDRVDLLSFVPIADLGGGANTRLNDIWGWTDPVTGSEYALVGRQDGVSFVDITDPEHPRLVGNLPTQTIATTWRDVKVVQDHAVVVADGAGTHGMQILDLSILRQTTGDPVVFEPTVVYDAFGSAHNVAVFPEADLAFAVGVSGSQTVPAGFACGRGSHIVDMSNPDVPSFAGCYVPNHGRGYTHDIQCIRYHGPDLDHSGKDICVGSDEVGISITDVTDPAAPEEIGRVSYPNVAYAHQGWLTDDHRFFILGDELDEDEGGTSKTRTMLFDLEDLDDPFLIDEYLGQTASIDHNMYVNHGLAYQANYARGLVILDLNAREELSSAGIDMVGHFDVFPGDDGTNFVGAWSVYPFFESGNVIVSGIESGLYVLDPEQKFSLFAADSPEAPGRVELEAFPNPSTDHVQITVSGLDPVPVRVDVFDVLGRQVAALFEGILPAGGRTFTFDTGDLPSGVYYVRVDGAGVRKAIPVTVKR